MNLKNKISCIAISLLTVSSYATCTVAVEDDYMLKSEKDIIEVFIGKDVSLRDFLSQNIRLTQRQRNTIFRVIEDLRRKSMRNLERAQDLAYSMPRCKTKQVCESAITGAISGLATRSAWGVVIGGALGAIGRVAVKTTDHYHEVYRLVRQAHRDAVTADHWQEKLYRND